MPTYLAMLTRSLRLQLAESCSRAGLAGIIVLALIVAAEPVYAQVGFDRPGGDYSKSSILSGDPVDCATQCERDRRCRAWSFNYPSEVANGALCWLKGNVPRRVHSNCCVSGVRGAGVVEPRTEAAEFSTDRAGGDYRNFDLKLSDGEGVCKQACEADNKCRAWTHARAGYAGRYPRCFLKNQIKAPLRRPGFTSGVVR